MKSRFDTYCGLYCGACMIMKANLTNTIDALALEWNIKPEDLRCNGCKTGTNYKGCVDCDIKECNQTKNLESCHECDEFPCAIITEFNNDEKPHHSIVLRNLKELSIMGIQKWMTKQKERWSCPNCSQPFSWYEKKCEVCNQELFDSESEEKKLLI